MRSHHCKVLKSKMKKKCILFKNKCSNETCTVQKETTSAGESEKSKEEKKRCLSDPRSLRNARWRWSKIYRRLLGRLIWLSWEWAEVNPSDSTSRLYNEPRGSFTPCGYLELRQVAQSTKKPEQPQKNPRDINSIRAQMHTRTDTHTHTVKSNQKPPF